eukprot:COSAG06_NODE_1757_length_8456_cov_13.708867_12_plen_59_part_00
MMIAISFVNSAAEEPAPLRHSAPRVLRTHTHTQTPGMTRGTYTRSIIKKLTHHSFRFA